MINLWGSLDRNEQIIKIQVTYKLRQLRKFSPLQGQRPSTSRRTNSTIQYVTQLLIEKSQIHILATQEKLMSAHNIKIASYT